MVVLEAWAHAKPVLMTPACNLPEGFTHRAALRVDPTPESLAPGLREVLALSSTELEVMGEQGRALVRKRFTWRQVASDMASVYRWVLQGGSQPSCIDAS